MTEDGHPPVAPSSAPGAFMAWQLDGDVWTWVEKEIPASSSCNGACCAVFPLHYNVAALRRGPPDQPFIADMVRPLSHRAARKRYSALGYGEMPPHMETAAQLSTCRHWDEEHRLCTVYEQRPGMCSDFPYGEACDRPGCDFRQPIAYLVRKAHAAWQGLTDKEVVTGDSD